MTGTTSQPAGPPPAGRTVARDPDVADFGTDHPKGYPPAEVEHWRPKQPLEAIRVTSGNMDAVAAWCGGEHRRADSAYRLGEQPMPACVMVPCERGTRIAVEGDWVMKGAAGFGVLTENELVADHEPTRRCACSQDEPCKYHAAEGEALRADAAGELLRNVLVAVCERDGVAVDSSVVPGEPARNYELAVRLGIGRVFGLDEDDSAVIREMRRLEPHGKAQLAVAVTALRRLALDEPMTVVSDDDPREPRHPLADLRARRNYAAGTLETIARLGEPVPPELADVRDDVLERIAVDWTIDPSTGASNSSDQFAVMCAAVGRLLRAEFQVIDRDAIAAAARHVMAQLAHVHGLAPAGHVAVAVEPGREYVEPALAPPLHMARVEVKGFRDLGVVALSETTLAGEPMVRAEDRDGRVSEFPASSVHFITRLPPGSQWPDEGRRRDALTAGHPADDGYWLGDDDDDEASHSPECCDAACHGCGERSPF